MHYIASLGEKTAIKFTILNIDTDTHHKKSSLLNEGLVGLYSQYQLVNIIEPYIDRAIQIYSNAGFEKIYGVDGLRQGIEEFIESEVHPDDRERYRKFMDMDTLKHRMTESGMSFITEAFRLRERTGAFRWALVTLVRVPSGVEVRYLYEIQETSRESAQELEKKFANK